MPGAPTSPGFCDTPPGSALRSLPSVALSSDQAISIIPRFVDVTAAGCGGTQQRRTGLRSSFCRRGHGNGARHKKQKAKWELAVRRRVSRNRHSTHAPETDTKERHSHRQRQTEAARAARCTPGGYLLIPSKQKRVERNRIQLKNSPILVLTNPTTILRGARVVPLTKTGANCLPSGIRQQYQ